MNIDYVVIASDDDETYLDFYNSVVKVWKNRMGLQTVFFHITSGDVEDFAIIQTKFGLTIKIKNIYGWPTALQSQAVRLLSSILFRDKNILISDIDMFPIDKKYFINKAKPIKEDEVLLYTGAPYGDVPFYPMCYILGKGETIADIIGFNNNEVLYDYSTGRVNMQHYEEYMQKLVDTYNGAWNTDENFFYDQVQKYHSPKKIKIGKRNFGQEKRLDRGGPFDVTQSFTGLVDAHSIRPYKTHKEKIDRLVKRLLYEK